MSKKDLKVPKTPKTFEYDLWISKDGKYMARVKATGQVSEVNHEVMKFLRALEKKARRRLILDSQENDRSSAEEGITVLSLDAVSYENDGKMQPNWFVDTAESPEEIVSFSELEAQFVKSLTPDQRDVYIKCLRGGMSLRKYARQMGISYNAVYEKKKDILQKYMEIFGDED